MPGSDATKTSWFAKLARVFGLGKARVGNSSSQDEKAHLLIDYLPDRQESCLQGATRAVETNNPIVRQLISSLEAPSAVAVIRSLFPGIRIEFQEIPVPDPRLPIRRVSTLLWRYDGQAAFPTLDAPPKSVTEALTRIARTPYHLDRWSELAAREMKESNLMPEDVLGALVHTPPHEASETPWDSRFRAQVAAALLLVHASERSRADPVEVLSDIVDGPIDWTTSAAIIALLDVARRKRKRRNEIFMLFMGVLKRPQNPIWLMNAGHNAAVACRHIPGLPDGVYATVDRIIAQLS